MAGEKWTSEVEETLAGMVEGIWIAGPCSHNCKAQGHWRTFVNNAATPDDSTPKLEKTIKSTNALTVDPTFKATNVFKSVDFPTIEMADLTAKQLALVETLMKHYEKQDAPITKSMAYTALVRSGWKLVPAMKRVKHLREGTSTDNSNPDLHPALWKIYEDITPAFIEHTRPSADDIAFIAELCSITAGVLPDKLWHISGGSSALAVQLYRVASKEIETALKEANSNKKNAVKANEKAKEKNGGGFGDGSTKAKAKAEAAAEPAPEPEVAIAAATINKELERFIDVVWVKLREDERASDTTAFGSA